MPADGSDSASFIHGLPKMAKVETLRESTPLGPLEASTSSTFKAPSIKRVLGFEGSASKTNAASGTAAMCFISVPYRQGCESFIKVVPAGKEGREAY